MSGLFGPDTCLSIDKDDGLKIVTHTSSAFVLLISCFDNDLSDDIYNKSRYFLKMNKSV